MWFKSHGYADTRTGGRKKALFSRLIHLLRSQLVNLSLYLARQAGSCFVERLRGSGGSSALLLPPTQGSGSKGSGSLCSPGWGSSVLPPCSVQGAPGALKGSCEALLQPKADPGVTCPFHLPQQHSPGHLQRHSTLTIPELHSCRTQPCSTQIPRAPRPCCGSDAAQHSIVRETAILV